MPKARKRKAPVTSAGAASGSGSPAAAAAAAHPAAHSPASTHTRTVIRRFHVLIKRQNQLQALLAHGAAARPRKPPAGADARRELAEVEREIAGLGGLDAYQRMSIAGQGKDRGGGSEKVLIGWLREMGMDAKGKGKASGNDGPGKLRVLEVGALKPDNYAACASWMEVTPIDLHSQHPNIEEQDFLLLDEDEHRGRWDLVSLSLVVNFVPEAKDRGRMLRLAHTILKPDGILFLALPLPCVINSRYLTLEHLQVLMKCIGFTQVKERWKQGGKMAYWLYSRDEPIQGSDEFERKVVLRSGNRNNFVILL